MPSFEIEFEVICAKCGAGLCNQSTGRDAGVKNRRYPYVEVEPCQECIDHAKNEAFDEGYDEGIKQV